MRLLRPALFWLHLVAGVVAGGVVLLMSLTGVVLTYEKQLLAWADARAVGASAPPAGGARLPATRLVEAARRTRADAPSALTVRADPTAPAAVHFGRAATVYVDPYTAAVLGEGAVGVRRALRTVTDWHRWLGREGEGRAAGKAITGAANLAFLVLVVTGVVLWLPRRWTRARLRQIGWFRRGLSGRARDFNWHHVIGAWTAVPLLVVVASGVVISYPWAQDLVHRAAGEEPPPRAGGGGRPGGGEGPPPLLGAAVDRALASAEREAWGRMPGWRTLQLTLPTAPEAAIAATVDAGRGGQPQRRASLTVAPATGIVERWEPFDALTAGRRARGILRFAHTGEVAGIAGQTVAGLASLGSVVLVWTGLALAARRLLGWRARRGRRVGESLPGAPTRPTIRPVALPPRAP